MIHLVVVVGRWKIKKAVLESYNADSLLSIELKATPASSCTHFCFHFAPLQNNFRTWVHEWLTPTKKKKTHLSRIPLQDEEEQLDQPAHTSTGIISRYRVSS